VKKEFLFIVLLLIGYASYSQRDLTFNHLGPNEGLTAEFMSYLTKDSKGFIWICSNYGLIRYDGQNFYNFRNSFTDTTTISNDNVSFVLEDRDGYLWVSTNQGLNRFNPETRKFERFEHDPYNINSIASNEVTQTLQDSKGRLWVGTTTGLSLYLGNGQFKNWTDFHSAEKPYKYTVHNLAQDKSDLDLLWLIGANGLFSFRMSTEKFTEHLPPLEEPESEDQFKNLRKSFTRIFVDSDGMLWIGNNFGEIFRYNPINKTWTIKSYESGSIYCAINTITACDDDHLWVCTSSLVNSTTLHKLDKKTLELKPFPADTTHHNFILSKPGITHVYEDNEGITWFTSSRSICKLDPFLQFFSYHPFKRPQGAEEGWVSAIIETSHHLLMSLDHELFKIDKLTNKFTLIPFPKQMKNLRVHTFFYDTLIGKTWIVTNYGLYNMNIKDDKISGPINDLQLPNRSSSITKLFKDSSGNLWVAFYLDGIFRFDATKQEWKELTSEIVSIKNSPQQLKIYDLEEDNNGVIWVATHAGIRLLDPDTGKLVKLDDYIQEGSKLRSLKVMNLTKDQQGNMWLGSLGNGLIGIKITKSVSSLYWAFGTKDGLCDNNISNVAIDNRGIVWATSHRGLICVDPASNKIQNYYKSDGLVSDRMNSFPIYASQNGIIYLATLSGYHSFDPTKFVKKSIVPPIHLLKTNRPVYAGNDSLGNNQLILKYFQNELSFSFNVLNYSKPEANRYKYQLIGFQNHWVSAGADNNTVSYTNLDPGTYTFRVKASNNDGVWNEQGASIKITILPPPWKTWWAFLLYALASILFIGIALNEVVKRERLKNAVRLKEIEAEKYHELDTIKSRFFANISHEFRTPLTLLLSPIEKRLKNTLDTNDKVELSIMHRNASRLLTLVNQLLDLSRIEAGTLSLKCSQGSLNAFINSIASQFSSMADSKEIDFAISGNQEITLFFDPDKLEKIITNLLSNAFKFTPNKGSITITLTQHELTENFKDGFVEIAVWDSGKGMAHEHLAKIFDRFYQADASSTREYEGSGIGLALTKELVELHKGSISVTSLKDEGSCFSVKLPLGSGHLKPHEIVVAAEQTRPLLAVQDLPIVQEMPSIFAEETELPKLLIVEDNADLRYYLRTNFGNHYSISEGYDGEMGLTMALEGVPDLIISDLMMPKMDGLNLCSKLKACEKTSHIPIILLTAKADIESKLQGLNTGADDYIAKPFDARELEVRVRNLIEGRKKLQQKFSQQLSLSATEIEVDSMEDRFLKKVKNTIEYHISDGAFSVEILADEAAMSSVQLYRKLKALTGHTPNELIRNLRLERAASLLSQRAGNVSDIAYQVGFNNLSYFAKCFKEKFGVAPSDFLNSSKS